MSLFEKDLYPAYPSYFLAIDMEKQDTRVCGFGYLRIVTF